MPSADFCTAVRRACTLLSPSYWTQHRPPEVSPTAFGASPPDLRAVNSWMDMDFVIDCSLVRHTTPRIRFLFIGARFC